jgi:hypothetical protein
VLLLLSVANGLVFRGVLPYNARLEFLRQVL